MESEGREGGDGGMAKESLRVWARNGKGLPENKNPLPIHEFVSNFHLLSLYGWFSLVVQLVSVQLWRHLELMRQLYHLRGEVL